MSPEKDVNSGASHSIVHQLWHRAEGIMEKRAKRTVNANVCILATSTSGAYLWSGIYLFLGALTDVAMKVTCHALSDRRRLHVYDRSQGSKSSSGQDGRAFITCHFAVPFVKVQTKRMRQKVVCRVLKNKDPTCKSYSLRPSRELHI